MGNINLTGMWNTESTYEGEFYRSKMELVHKGDRVLGRYYGGDYQYFLEGDVLGNGFTLHYFEMCDGGTTGRFEIVIEQDGNKLKGYYIEEPGRTKIPWEAIREKQ